MAKRLQPKQIEDYKIAWMGVSSFSGSGTSDTVTTQVTAAAAADGVPVQVGSTTTEGFITSGTNNKSLVTDSSSKVPLEDGAGNEVFARLTEAAGVYTLSYFSIVSGTETSFVLPATTIDFLVPYSYLFKDMPHDAFVKARVVNVGEDSSNSAGRPIRNEKITVTALNTLNASGVAFLPIANSVAIYVNGKAEAEGASEAFTRVGKILTWDATDAGYDLETTDDVVVHYNTLA